MRRGAIGIVGATVAIVALAGLLAVRLGGGDERPTTTGGPAAGEVGERPAADDDDGGAVAAGPAPLAVVAVQGPVEQTARYVAVSWSHVDLDRSPVEPPRAVGYDKTAGISAVINVIQARRIIVRRG